MKIVFFVLSSRRHRVTYTNTRWNTRPRRCPASGWFGFELFINEIVLQVVAGSASDVSTAPEAAAVGRTWSAGTLLLLLLRLPPVHVPGPWSSEAHSPLGLGAGFVIRHCVSFG